MTNYKGAEIRLFQNKGGVFANISYGRHWCIPLGYNKGYSNEEALTKAKERVDEILKG